LSQSEAERFQSKPRTKWGLELDTDRLAQSVHRLASFLSDLPHNIPKQLCVAPRLQSKDNSNEKKTATSVSCVLERLLSEFCLPSSLNTEILTLLSPLGLLSLSATVTPYTPDSPDWAAGQFPGLTKRCLALILLALKFHCGLDGQYEVVQSHNLHLLAPAPHTSQYFDFLTWLRLSKLRLDQIVARCYRTRQQYRGLLHPGTPPLAPDQVVAMMQDWDTRNLTRPPAARLAPLAHLLAGVARPAPRPAPPAVTLHPLTGQTELVLQEAGPSLQQQLATLQAYRSASTKLCHPLHLTLANEKNRKEKRNSLEVKHGINLKSFDIIKVKLENNFIVTSKIKGGNPTKHQYKGVKMQSNDQYMGRLLETRGGARYSGRGGRGQQWGHSLVQASRNYWSSAVRRPGVWSSPYRECPELTFSRAVLHTLPHNFAWILQYFAAYACLNPLSLLSELNKIETLVTAVDPNYFGYQRHIKSRDFNTKD